MAVTIRPAMDLLQIAQRRAGEEEEFEGALIEGTLLDGALIEGTLMEGTAAEGSGSEIERSSTLGK